MGRYALFTAQRLGQEFLKSEREQALLSLLGASRANHLVVAGRSPHRRPSCTIPSWLELDLLQSEEVGISTCKPELACPTSPDWHRVKTKEWIPEVLTLTCLKFCSFQVEKVHRKQPPAALLLFSAVRWMKPWTSGWLWTSAFIYALHSLTRKVVVSMRERDARRLNYFGVHILVP